MLARIEDLAKMLEHNKTTAQQQIEEQVTPVKTKSED